jgi:hypothetical protein
LNVNANGSIDANVTITSAGVFNVTGTTLTVRDVRQPNLENKSYVFTSSNSMVTSGVLSLTGLGKSVDLQAMGGDCTFTVNSGDAILVDKNTGENFDYAYTLNNPSVTLTAKDAAATCKVRIVGAN